MVKVHKNITIDNDVWQEALAVFPRSISCVINDYLRTLLSTKKKDMDSIQIEIERLKLEQESKQLAEIQSSIQTRSALIQEHERRTLDKMQVELEQKKKQIDQEKSCFKCDDLADRVYKEQPICKICYMNM